MAKAPAAKALVQEYLITAKQVRQTVAGMLQKPLFGQGEPDPWDTMTRAEKTAWTMEQLQGLQNARMQQGHENVLVWADQIQFNAGFMLDTIAAVQAKGFYVRTVNNNLDNYDELEISARPFV